MIDHQKKRQIVENIGEGICAFRFTIVTTSACVLPHLVSVYTEVTAAVVLVSNAVGQEVDLGPTSLRY